MANSMKIVKPGKLPELEVLHGTCHCCKCEIEIMLKDCKSDTHRNETIYSVMCPTEGCGHTINPEKKPRSQ